MLHRNESLNHSTSWGALASLCESESHSVMSKLFFFFSCPTLCDPMDYTVHGIFQARILEWVAFPFSRGWLRRNVKCLWKEKCRDSHYSPVTNFLNEDYYIFAYFPFCSVPELCLTLCNPVDGSTPGFPVLHYPLEFAQIHVYWVRDAI